MLEVEATYLTEELSMLMTGHVGCGFITVFCVLTANVSSSVISEIVTYEISESSHQWHEPLKDPEYRSLTSTHTSCLPGQVRLTVCTDGACSGSDGVPPIRGECVSYSRCGLIK